MNNMFQVVQQIEEYMVMGGEVVVPLVLVSVVLWYGLSYRLMSLRPSSFQPSVLLDKALSGNFNPRGIAEYLAQDALQRSQAQRSIEQVRAVLHENIIGVRVELSRYRVLVHTLVVIAPLLGLLGTVNGMIETFDSLGDMVLFSQSGGIAGGISKALLTTQIGLVVSIPGLLLGRMIDRREKRMLREFYQFRDLICAQASTIK